MGTYISTFRWFWVVFTSKRSRTRTSSKRKKTNVGLLNKSNLELRKIICLKYLCVWQNRIGRQDTLRIRRINNQPIYSNSGIKNQPFSGLTYLNMSAKMFNYFLGRQNHLEGIYFDPKHGSKRSILYKVVGF